jgi:hypothetical protein
MRKGTLAEYGFVTMSNTEPPSRRTTARATPLVELATAQA